MAPYSEDDPVLTQDSKPIAAAASRRFTVPKRLVCRIASGSVWAG